MITMILELNLILYLKNKQLKALSVCSSVETVFTMYDNILTLNSCDDLKAFMLSHLDESLSDTANFQGDIVEFNGYGVPKEGEIIPIDGYDVNFKVGTINEVTNTCVLTLGKFTDEAFGVELPAYVREELISTLKDEW